MRTARKSSQRPPPNAPPPNQDAPMRWPRTAPPPTFMGRGRLHLLLVTADLGLRPVKEESLGNQATCSMAPSPTASSSPGGVVGTAIRPRSAEKPYPPIAAGQNSDFC